MTIKESKEIVMVVSNHNHEGRKSNINDAK
jgi:hypothetical protein